MHPPSFLNHQCKKLRMTKQMTRWNLVDRDMAQFRFGPFKVVPREKIITYLGQTSGYLHGSVLIQTGRSVYIQYVRRPINFYCL